MADILDYLDWRGDLPLDADPFNEVDNLLLAELSFIPFTGFVPAPGEGEAVPLGEAAARYFAVNPKQDIDMGVLVPDRIPELLDRMAHSTRFRDVGLNCFTDHLDHRRAIQFAALAFELPDNTLYLSFRGTDDTIAGWKEDFEMSFLDEVPAQREAVEYVRAVAGQYRRRKLRLGGHSKGGNLAVYSGVHCGAALQRRIAAVYNNDGPGFRASLLDRPEHIRIAGRITTIVPASSVVGLLMEHEEDYLVVESCQLGVLQHDGFSWEVLGNRFVHLPADAPTLRRNDETLKQWVNGMDEAQRRRFTAGLFDILEATGAATLKELTEEGFKAAAALLKAMSDLDRETREALTYACKLLFRAQVRAITEDLAGAGPLKKLTRRKRPAPPEKG